MRALHGEGKRLETGGGAGGMCGSRVKGETLGVVQVGRQMRHLPHTHTCSEIEACFGPAAVGPACWVIAAAAAAAAGSTRSRARQRRRRRGSLLVPKQPRHSEA